MPQERSRESVKLVAKRSRRDLLLDEAARQLNARGISQTSLIDVAAGLGLSRAAVYYYADDRQDLVFQCYRRACESLARDLAPAARQAGGALDRIADFITRSLDPERVEEAVLSEVAYLGDEQRDTIEALAGGVLAQLAGLIDEGQRRSEIRPCDSRIIAQALIGIVSWVPLAPRWIGGGAAGADVAALADPARRQRHPGDDADQRQSDDLRVAGPDLAAALPFLDQRDELGEHAARQRLDRRALVVAEIGDLAQHRFLDSLGIEAAGDEGGDPVDRVTRFARRRGEVARQRLAGAAIALEDQVLAVVGIIIDGGARQAEPGREVDENGLRDAARVELARRLVEQQVAPAALGDQLHLLFRGISLAAGHLSPRYHSIRICQNT